MMIFPFPTIISPLPTARVLSSKARDPRSKLAKEEDRLQQAPLHSLDHKAPHQGGNLCRILPSRRTLCTSSATRFKSRDRLRISGHCTPLRSIEPDVAAADSAAVAPVLSSASWLPAWAGGVPARVKPWIQKTCTKCRRRPRLPCLEQFQGARPRPPERPG